MTRISIYPTTSDPLAHAAAGACRSLRASRQCWLAAGLMATLMHAEFYSSLGRFALVSMPELFYQRGDPAKACQLSIPCLSVIGTQRLQRR
jgi:hypothetical protein